MIAGRNNKEEMRRQVAAPFDTPTDLTQSAIDLVFLLYHAATIGASIKTININNLEI